MAKKPMTQKQAEALAKRRADSWNQDYRAYPDPDNPGYWIVGIHIPDQSWFHEPMGTFKGEPGNS